MPKNHRNHNHNIRKRGCSSSSSSSSLVVKSCRFKRTVLVGRSGAPGAGSSGLVFPTWRIIPRSPVSAMQADGGEDLKCRDGSKGRKSQLSARKLAATLWEIKGGGRSPEGKERERKSLEKMCKVYDSESLQLHPLGRSHITGSEKIGDGSKPGGRRRRSSVNSQKLQLTEYIATGADPAANEFLIESTRYATAENMASVKRHLKDVRNSLTASKEIVKVLFRMWSEEEQHSLRLTLISALRVELDRSRLEIDQAIQEQRFSCREVNGFLKQLVMEKQAWKSREQDRIHEAILAVARELENEKKMRRQAERLNKKLGSELGDVKADLSKVMKELENERRTREILEQTCDELAQGIGEDGEEVEELKRESAKAREEVEKERQMLQLADMLREERVQMKLADARFEFEEKTAALERLRSQLEGYYGNSTSRENGSQEYADLAKKMAGPRANGHGENSEREREEEEEEEEEEGEGEGEGEGEEGEGEEESGDSELHSIELNMDEKNKIYKWGFACDDGSAQGGDSRRPSTEEMFKGRKSLNEKIQWENICLYKQNSDIAGSEQENENGSDKARSLAACQGGEINGVEDEAKSLRSGKTLKDHMYPSVRAASSPTLLESSVARASQSNSTRC